MLFVYRRLCEFVEHVVCIWSPKISSLSVSPIKMNYSIEGLSLRLNTREDIAPYLHQIEPNITQLEEIHLCGNTLGVGAAQALAEVLRKASAIRVRAASMSHFSASECAP